LNNLTPDVLITDAGTTGNVLAGNVIGTSLSGYAVPANGFSEGVWIQGGAAGNLIGGASRALGNLIFGLSDGVYLQSFAGAGNAPTGNVIENNLIGTNVAGTAGFGEGNGVTCSGDSGTQILNNLISGNVGTGVRIDSNNALVAGNYIGTDVSGSAALPNGTGVNITGGTGNVIGGTTAAARNVIAGNSGDGVVLWYNAKGNVIEGNYIGVAADGATARGNGKRGVYMWLGAASNTVGGTAAGAGNVIAYNGDDGVLIGANAGDTNPADEAGQDNRVLGNSIFGNGKLGIDLGPDDGVTPNSTTGPGSPNNYLNWPTLSAAASGGSSLVVQGTWTTGGFSPGAAYRVEVFASPTADASGHGEGRTFLGAFSIFVTNFSNPFAGVVPYSAADGSVISATVTDPYGNTSEFSTDVTVH
jgi:titin